MSNTRRKKPLGWIAVIVVGILVVMGSCLSDDSDTGPDSGVTTPASEHEGNGPVDSPREPAEDPDPAEEQGPDASAVAPDAAEEAAAAESDGPLPEVSPHLGPAEPLVARARVALPALEIKGRAPRTGYDRDEFGSAWSDDVSVIYGRNGCDTRNDILSRDLTEISYRDDCIVETGVLHDPFTGEVIDFERGPDTSQEVQIDHVVSLSDAWQKGAQQMSETERRDFANDPLNLLAVDGPTNQAKGDGDTATWLPPNRDFRCQFASIQVLVKERYGLWATQAEHEAMGRILAGC